MLRLLIGAAIALTSTIAYAQQAEPFNDLQFRDTESPATEVIPEVAEEYPVMTSFPVAVPPSIQFGNQCPHECNPCNYSLWDNYCSEKVLWCQKTHRHGCCKRKCRQKSSCSSCNSGCGGVPCAQATPYRLPDTVSAEFDEFEAVASKPETTKTALRPRPSATPLPFWTDQNTGISIER